MLNKTDATRIINEALDVKTDATAVLSWQKAETTRFANNEISQNTAITDAEVTLTLYDGKRRASAKTNVLTSDGISALRQNAKKLLRLVPEGEFGYFGFSDEITPEHSPDDKLADAFSAEGRADVLAKAIGCVQPNYVAAGALTLKRTALCVGAATGAVRYTAYDSVSFNTVVTHDDGAAGGAECVSYTEPPDVVQAMKKAQATSEAARNPISPTLGTHTAILSPTAFSTLVLFLTRSFNAKMVLDNISFTTGKLGHKLFASCLNVRDHAGQAGLRPLHFDIEGNPRRILTLIDEGVVANFVTDNASAKRLDIAPTGHAIGYPFGGIATNLVVGEGDDGLAEIIAATPNGVFINELHYTNFVNPRQGVVTGLTRNGTFLIENGKLTKPLSTVRFTVSLLDVLANIAALSAEREKVGDHDGIMLVPAAKIEGFVFTSKA